MLLIKCVQKIKSKWEKKENCIAQSLSAAVARLINDFGSFPSLVSTQGIKEQGEMSLRYRLLAVITSMTMQISQGHSDRQAGTQRGRSKMATIMRYRQSTGSSGTAPYQAVISPRHVST